MKKLIIMGALVVLSLFCVGCGKVIDLTEEENHLIAEYAAELLMKYGTNIDLKYYYEDKKHNTNNEATPLDAEVTEAATENTTQAMTEAATETTTELISEENTEANGTEAENGNVTTAQSQPMENVANVSNNVLDKDTDIASIVGEKNMAIHYAYYMVVDKYPSYDQDGLYIEIGAPAGYKLLVVKFNVENKTNNPLDVDLYNKDLSYKIIVDNTKAAKQMLTILMDDLYTYQKTMEPSLFEEDVLLFQVSDDVAATMSDLKLGIIYNGNETVMNLQ